MKKTVAAILFASLCACNSSPTSQEASQENAPLEAPAAPAPIAESGISIAAADCSFTSVQTAVRNANSGATVLIPAGDCNWGTASLIIPGGVSLKGAGRDATLIRRGGPVGAVASLLRYECAAGSAPVAVSNLQLIGWGKLGSDDMGLRLEKFCTQDFRIFENKFSKFTFAAININGEGAVKPPRGAIYNNEIVNNYTSGRESLGYGIAMYANNQPGNLAAVLGSSEAVFIEDNIFSGNRHSATSSAAARYVFRYNKITTTNEVQDWGQVDAHGTTSAASKSAFSWEIYNNTFLSSITDGGTGWAVFLRGGDGVVFNNTYDRNVQSGIGLTLEKGCTSGIYPVADQIRTVHIWSNSLDRVHFYAGDGDCTQFFKENREYFFAARPGYTPYTYPHPQRSQ
jgi:hypothetical protein